jgi:hypothetical protein
MSGGVRRAGGILLFWGVLTLTGCATPYQRMSAATISGGYVDQDLGREVIRVQFSANGFTTRETAQTFWLWRCAEVALEKHYDGFEILSDMRLVDAVPGVKARPETEAHSQTVAYVPIYVPNDDSNKPFLTGDIHLLKGPISTAPPKVFDARVLKEALAPYVLPILKDGGNVKPHIHEYLLPAGKLSSGAAPGT